MTAPTVGVVIPTIGRPSLVRAVASALDQTLAPSVVVLVADCSREDLPGEVTADPRVVVVELGGGSGVAAARNAGIAILETDFVAFLDDDDQWAPAKLARQVTVARAILDAGAAHVVTTCRQVMVDEGGLVQDRWPRRVIRDGEGVADYLFTRRHVRPGESAVSASMMLCDLAVARKVPFTGASVHEDWAWLLDAADVPGCHVVGLTDELLRYTRSRISASNAICWRDSMRWVLERPRQVGARPRGDFLLCVSAPLALHTGDLSGLRGVVRIAHREGSPGLPARVFLALLTLRVLAGRFGTGLRRRIR